MLSGLNGNTVVNYGKKSNNCVCCWSFTVSFFCLGCGQLWIGKCRYVMDVISRNGRCNNIVVLCKGKCGLSSALNPLDFHRSFRDALRIHYIERNGWWDWEAIRYSGNAAVLCGNKVDQCFLVWIVESEKCGERGCLERLKRRGTGAKWRTINFECGHYWKEI